MTPTACRRCFERPTGTRLLAKVNNMERFFWICFAGAAGTGTRYLVGLWAGERFGSSFPYRTLLVNVVGCFLIALVMHWALNVAAFSPNLRFGLTTGFLGGLTTYSGGALVTMERVRVFATLAHPRAAPQNLDLLESVRCRNEPLHSSGCPIGFARTAPPVVPWGGLDQA